MFSDKPLTLGDFQKAIDSLDSLIPEFNSPDIDEFVAKGNNIEDVTFVTSIESLENVPRLRTKHGILKVRYNRYLRSGTNILVNTRINWEEGEHEQGYGN